MNTPYPRQFSDVAQWAITTGSDIATARFRYAQYLVLRSIASVPELRSELVFKGGNALDFAWQPNRSTLDLDFTIENGEYNEESLGARLAMGLAAVSSQTGSLLQLHSVSQQPRGANRTRVTYKTLFGYALPDDVALRKRMERGLKSSRTIQADISKNDPICGSTHFELDDRHVLRICTVEDIVAEKLRAILQQKVRNRYRPQDVIDIALAVRTYPNLDRPDVAAFLLRKSTDRDVVVSRRAYRDPEIADRARSDYATLQNTTRNIFIPFEEAFTEVLSLVDSLDIPDE